MVRQHADALDGIQGTAVHLDSEGNVAPRARSATSTNPRRSNSRPQA